MYEEILARAGLTNDQARIYEILLKNGSLPAGTISKKAYLKRGLTYKILDELADLDLIERRDDAAKILMFSPVHPMKLQELAERKEREAKFAQSAIGGVIGQLTSDFNLISGKPGVTFYEGRDGIKKVLDDSLTSKTEICSYADIESIVKYIENINKQYVKKRDDLQIKKRAIILDSHFARKYLADYYKQVTEIKFIRHKETKPFQSVMQIYDNKISYITLEPERMIGVTISDRHLYEMHLYFFEYIWQHALEPEH